MGTAGRWAAVAAALLLAAPAAGAATVTWPDGKFETLAADREVTGPAVVTSTDGKDTLRLFPGAVVRFLGAETDAAGNRAESFLLKRGAVRADLGFFTRLGTPAYWAFSESRETRAVLRAAVFPGPEDGPRSWWCHARAESGSGLVRLVLEPGEGVHREIHVLEGQGVLVAREKAGGVRFTTDADNRGGHGRVRLVYPLAKGRFLDAYIARGVEGALLDRKEGRVLAACHASSAKGKGIDLFPVADGKETAKFILLPGMAVTEDLEAAEGEGTPAPPATAEGTLLLDGSFRVAGLEADLASEKPWIRFTLERADPAGPGVALKDLRFDLSFRRGGVVVETGAADREPRPIRFHLEGKDGNVLRVDSLPEGGVLAGALPVLRLLR